MSVETQRQLLIIAGQLEVIIPMLEQQGRDVTELQKELAAIKAVLGVNEKYSDRDRTELLRKMIDGATDISDIKTRLGDAEGTIEVLEERMTEVEETLDEKDKNKWSVAKGALVAVIGGAGTLLGQWILKGILAALKGP